MVASFADMTVEEFKTRLGIRQIERTKKEQKTVTKAYSESMP